ncbi:hypothetical protein PTI45_03166 [Paenibacillus nuruki]|uniref:Spo0E like sporulation regulatory protein n=2 Tax=Paenibacillus TaxID=44249 RepID=A0A1E3L148_9BACL|nr:MULTISPECIES: aspartyl-phosphate phosphatase Spo0E family protein [Paenibacillus]ODP27456.1 hypothetical protein PTI45_03166 [Paenibacillus nuruki]
MLYKNSQLEFERKKLNQLADRYGISDERVLKQSQVLDTYINDYNLKTAVTLQFKS